MVSSGGGSGEACFLSHRTPRVGNLGPPCSINVGWCPPFNRVQNWSTGGVERAAHCLVPRTWVDAQVIPARIVLQHVDLPVVCKCVCIVHFVEERCRPVPAGPHGRCRVYCTTSIDMESASVKGTSCSRLRRAQHCTALQCNALPRAPRGASYPCP